MSCDNMVMKKSEIAFLLKNTRFDEQEITQFYRLDTLTESGAKHL